MIFIVLEVFVVFVVLIVLKIFKKAFIGFYRSL